MDLNGNTFTDSTYTIAAGAGEPGYVDLKPAELGGDATRPENRVTFVSQIHGNIEYADLQLVVTTEAELRAALANANVDAIFLGDDIVLSEHINLNNHEGLVIDGNGKTVLTVYDGRNPCGFYLASNDITIKNVTITGASNVGIDTKHGTEGFTIENVTLKDMRIGFYANPNVGGTIKSCHFDDLGIGIGYGADASLIITDNIFENINKYLEIFGRDSDDEELEEILSKNTFDATVMLVEQDTAIVVMKEE